MTVVIVLRNVKRSIALLGLSGKTRCFREGQSNKKCLVSSIASLLGQIGFIVILYVLIYEARSNGIRVSLGLVTTSYF